MGTRGERLTAAERALLEAEAGGADLATLRANLALSPSERLAELVEMNRFHAELQARTLDPELRAALDARELEAARARLRQAED